jgi:DNA-binding NtrC family response regulator
VKGAGAPAQSVYLVDPDQQTRRARALILMTHGYDVSSTSSLPRSLPFADRKTDLVLLACGEGRRNWLGSWKRIKDAAPSQRVLVLPFARRLCAMFSEGVEVSPRRDIDHDLPGLVIAALAS